MSHLNTLRLRREKMFGRGLRRSHDRAAKMRIWRYAQKLSIKTEKGKAYGVITAKALAVFGVLLWGHHNAKSGDCFPGYEKIMEAAKCARSTVAQALKALEAAGILTWVNRLIRVWAKDEDGRRYMRVVRTSNAYVFNDPEPPKTEAVTSKSDFPPGTINQGFISLSTPADPPKTGMFSGFVTGLGDAMERFGKLVRGKG